MYTYQNPIVEGYNPDPSIVRVGEEFFLVTSTFEFFPGVPIYRSKNLVNWELVNYCLTRDSQLPLEGARNSGGIFAPTIRYHDGTFYMITTNVTHGGNFIVHTDDIYGEWSEPAWIAHRGIDPSLLFDDDGKVYFCGTGEGGIAVAEINPRTGELLSDVKVVTRGAGGKHPEAPHLYKINGLYYLMIAEGGTEFGHRETLFRAENPFGPYAPCPRNPILSHLDYQGSPIQATGHADLVEDQNGNWWLVCLGIRPLGFSMLHNLGRETFLSPVTWDQDGWPVVGDGGRIAPEMTAPLPAAPGPRSVDFEDDFRGDKLSLHWNFVRNPDRARYALTADGLRLSGGQQTLADDRPTLIATRQRAFHMRAEAELTRSPGQGKCGLTAYYNKDYSAAIYLTEVDGEARVELVSRVHGLTAPVASQTVSDGQRAEFALTTDRKRYTFYYREGGRFKELGSVSTAGFCTEGTMDMTFTGTYIGLFAEANDAKFHRFSLKKTDAD